MKTLGSICNKKRLCNYLFEKIHHNKFFRSILIVSGGTLIAQIIIIIFSPILTRIYGPEDFGIFAIYISFLTISLSIVSLRYEFAIPLPKKDGDAINIFIVASIIIILISLSIGLILYIFSDVIFPLVGITNLHNYFVVASVIGLLSAGFFQITTYLAIRLKDFRPLAEGKLGRSLAQVSVQALVANTFGSLGLLAGDIGGRIIGLLVILLRLSRNRQGRQGWLQDINFSTMLTQAYRYRRFPLFSAWASLFNSVGLQLPLLLFVSYYGTTVVGWLSLSQRVIGIPMLFLGQSVSDVYFSEASTLVNEDVSQLYKLFHGIVVKLLFWGILPIIFLAVVGPASFVFVFGKEWTESGVYLRILSIMFLAQFVASPISRTLSVLERQGLELIWNFSRFLVISGIIVIAAGYLKYSATVTIRYYSISMALMYLLLILFCEYALRQKMKDESNYTGGKPVVE